MPGHLWRWMNYERLSRGSTGTVMPCPCSPMVKPLGRHVRAVERDVRSGRGSIRALARARLSTKKELLQIIPMHTMTREIIPGRKTEGSTVSSINSDRSSLI